jgi:ankyrin repeat protein
MISRNTLGYTPLMTAIEAGKADVSAYILQQFPRCANWRNKKGQDAVGRLSSLGNEVIILTSPTS